MAAIKEKILPYPKEYYNLLYDAGLIGTGTVMIHAYISDAKRVTLDESSATWMHTKEPVYDRSGKDLYMETTPLEDTNGLIVGDWTTGLTKEKIKTIHEECNIPKFDLTTSIRLYHGKEYDLSNPRDMAEYKLLENKHGAICFSKSDCETFECDFYFVSREADRRVVKDNLRKRMAAVLLINEASEKMKALCVTLLSHMGKIALRNDVEDEDMHMLFDELCLDKPKLIRMVYDLEDKDSYLMLYEMISYGLLYKTGEEGPYHRPLSASDSGGEGKVFAESTSKALKALYSPVNAKLRRDLKIRKGEIKDDSVVSNYVSSEEAFRKKHSAARDEELSIKAMEMQERNRLEEKKRKNAMKWTESKLKGANHELLRAFFKDFDAPYDFPEGTTKAEILPHAIGILKGK